MSGLYRRLRTRRQYEHTSQNTGGHRADKRVGDERNAERWVLLKRDDIAGSTGACDFDKVPGRDFLVIDGRLGAVEPSMFVHQMTQLKQQFGYYRGAKRRGDKVTETQLRCVTPLSQLTITLAPWVREFLAAGASEFPERVAALLERVAGELLPVVGPETGRKVVGLTIHTDTATPHLNFILSKIVPDADGIPRRIGQRGLGLAGPWLVGVDRQRRAGIVFEPTDGKFENAIRQFCERHGPEALPTDIRLSRKLDAFFEAHLGTLKEFKGAYREKVDTARAGIVEERKRQLRSELQALEELELPETEPQKEKDYGKN